MCQEQTLVLTEQFSSMERDAFHVSYLSYKIPEAVFHGHAVKTVAYLRVSTAQQDVRSQRLAILEYARKHDFRIDDSIEATASGQASDRRDWNRKEPGLTTSRRLSGDVVSYSGDEHIYFAHGVLIIMSVGRIVA